MHALYALSVVVMCGKAKGLDDMTARAIMDELLRKVVSTQSDLIFEFWQSVGGYER